MKAHTLSIVVGDSTCNAKCPYCVSSMTPEAPGECVRGTPINERRFMKAATLARDGGASTAMITGKGEPTLSRSKIARYIELADQAGFPLIELQTNGLLLRETIGANELGSWRDRGLVTVCISCAGFDPEKNRQIFTPRGKNPLPMEPLIEKIHGAGLSVRLNCILHAQSIDTPKDVFEFAAKARELGVEQTTLVPVTKPEVSRDDAVSGWIEQNAMTPEKIKAIRDALGRDGKILAKLPWGAEIYDVGGQNVCLSNCLTRELNQEAMRNLIYYDSGKLTWSWEFQGSVIF